MPDTTLHEAILHMDLILRVNSLEPLYAHHRLPPWLETTCLTSLADARTQNSAHTHASGDLSGARLRIEEAIAKIAGLVRNAKHHFDALPAEEVPPADQLDALETLGFLDGELGPLGRRAHLLALADTIVRENPTLPTNLRVPTAIINRLINWLAIYRANDYIARGGNRQDLTDDKNAARERLLEAIAQVRLYLCATDRRGEYTPLIARYNFQPKRNPGDAQPQPLPDTPGETTFDPDTRLLSIATLPDHATSLVAWRQSGEAAPVVGGISNTPQVSVSDLDPLQPGVTYRFWVTGRNSRGDGPPGNTIDHTA
jgi:hypothetical protein